MFLKSKNPKVLYNSCSNWFQNTWLDDNATL